MSACRAPDECLCEGCEYAAFTRSAQQAEYDRWCADQQQAEYDAAMREQWQAEHPGEEVPF